MLKKFSSQIKTARGDGAYDASNFRKQVHAKGGTCIVPPPRGAAYKGSKDEAWEEERDAALAAIAGFGGNEIGRKLWKVCAGYHERSLVETAMYRMKRMFGDRLKKSFYGSTDN